MNNTYFELFFTCDDDVKKLFIELVFELGIEAIEEKDGGVFVRSNDDLSEICNGLEVFSKQLEKAKIHTNFHQNLTQKDNKNWIEEYKRGIEPILVDKIYIHTTWQSEKKDFLNIIIDPALAFGSGHHESTKACLSLIQKYAKADMKALDVGCGSGILSIALAKLNAKVQICDTDELAILSAENNAKLNKIKFEKSWLGSINKTQDKFDMICANIIADVILILQNELINHLNDNAILILSGILEKYENRIKEAFVSLTLVEMLKDGEWLSFVYKK